MKVTRRDMLRLLALLPSACMAANADSASNSDYFEHDYWDRAWALNDWSSVALSVSVAGFDGVRLEHRALNRWASRMDARGFLRLPLHSPTDLDLTFLRHPGDAPIVDARMRGGQRFFVLPATTTLGVTRWAEFGWCFEEWMARAIAGSFMTDFPRNVDLSDIASVLGVRDKEERLCAAALQVFPAAATAAVDAVIDAEESLAFQGCEMDALFATLHGPVELKAIGDVASALMDFAPNVIVGQDFEHTHWPSKGVSVIATGYR